MSDQFFNQPILNSPYDYPSRHWELDDSGQPTQQIVESRRASSFISPIPKPRRHRGEQATLALDEVENLADDGQRYRHSELINSVRREVDAWRRLPPTQWRVTPETARLLEHWRNHKFAGVRPFFCQVEAAETAIWLTEVVPQLGKSGERFLDHLKRVSNDANPGLMRLALKLATGAGKTTVMAMLIAWQTVNAVRHPQSKKFTRGFLLVAPGLTIKDRLRVLLPNDADSYYASREIVPRDMLADLDKAKIVITNYHAFKLRERMELSKGGRRLLQGRTGSELDTLETEGQMLQRVMPELMGLKNILAINDEAHHCYREKPASDDDFIDDKGNPLTGDDLKAAKEHVKDENEAARLWISGLEAVNRKLGVQQVIDLSATPFFLAGSGYVEGTLFPWTMSDFSLMDAIECGIVKLPRVPIAQNLPGDFDMPMFRDLWKHIGKKMPKKGRGKGAQADPEDIPQLLKSALDALYGHYLKTYEAWKQAGIKVPPCFIVVCNNTATSKLVFDYISGFDRRNDDGKVSYQAGRLELFRNYDEHGEPLARPNTLLIDSEQLESGEALDDNFRGMAADEIERFKREIIERTGDRRQAENLSDSELLREVMNTVGKQGRLGEQIRCVVSVSMLTEGWDANTVTHVLGVRAFGTQLLCEQVIGRALRRQSYELNEQGLFDVEYADVFGIPFDFTAKPVVATPPKPRETVTVKALRPERDSQEIRFPRVQGYRVELPEERLEAAFGTDDHLTLTPEQVGPTETRNAGIIGEAVELNLKYLGDVRQSTLLMELTKHLLFEHWRDQGQDAPIALFGQLKRIVREWLEECLECKGGTYPAQLMHRELADLACQKITRGIVKRELEKGQQVKAILDPFNPTGSTAHVRFNTSREDRWETLGPPPKNQVNWVILDSGWESEFCRVAESHPSVLAYTKNHNLGLEVPYRFGSANRIYIPDFIVQVDDGHGKNDPLNLIVEIKGYRREDAKEKKSTMDTYWIPGVNHLGTHGRWAFAEFGDVYEMQEDFAKEVEAKFNQMIESAVPAPGNKEH
ncbi:BPTD_3080 family restriction endonuclease [Luteibacter yeojuensis]|uniref:BPTD_3080 family restriction endonuclease n=1 Tax=Luteibacter yeojuensis TaxID=345309 RepID=UPI0030844615